MKIVIISYMDLRGPGVTHSYYFANELVRRGHQIIFLLNGSRNTISLMPESPLFELIEIRFAGMFLHKKIVRRIKRFAPDIIHIWTPRHIPARAGLELKYHTKAKLIVHYEDDEDFLYDFHNGYILKNLDYFVRTIKSPTAWIWKHPIITYLANEFADAFTTICPSLQKAVEKRWFKKVYLLFPGVDLERFNPKLNGIQLRQRLNLQSQKVVLYSGSLDSIYDFDILLSAMNQIKKYRSDVVLVHCGRILNRHEIKKRVNQLKIGNEVLLLGPVAHRDMPEVLAVADILVQPGRPNPFNRFRLPAKIPEYMAMGKPIVTYAEGFGELLIENEEVVKTYTAKPEELATKIINLFGNDGLCQKLGHTARSKAEDLFDLKKNGQQLERIYLDTKYKERLYEIGSYSMQKEILTETIDKTGELNYKKIKRILFICDEMPCLDRDNTRVWQTKWIGDRLESLGHEIIFSVPERLIRNEEGVFNSYILNAWQDGKLDKVLEKNDPDIVCFSDWRLIAKVRKEIKIPVILVFNRPSMLDKNLKNSHPFFKTISYKVNSIRKADFFILNEESQKDYFLFWLKLSGFDPYGNFLCLMPKMSDSADDEEIRRRIQPLASFCQKPFFYQPKKKNALAIIDGNAVNIRNKWQWILNQFIPPFIKAFFKRKGLFFARKMRHKLKRITSS